MKNNFSSTELKELFWRNKVLLFVREKKMKNIIEKLFTLLVSRGL